LNQAKLIVIY